MQASLPLQPQRSVSFRQDQILPNHSHRGHDNHRAGDKDRTELGRGLAAVGEGDVDEYHSEMDFGDVLLAGYLFDRNIPFNSRRARAFSVCRGLGVDSL